MVTGGDRAAGSPTMLDVAQEAGVSRALVSIVFRGVPGASDETREHVLAVADRIGYHPNRSASLLARRRTRQLGVVLDLHNTFHADLADSVMASALEAGYHAALLPRTSRQDERAAISSALELRCEALILLGPSTPRTALPGLTAGLPAVSVGLQVDLPTFDVVRTADDVGMGSVVDHLVGRGHRAIVHIDGGEGAISEERRGGFRTAVARHGLDDAVRMVSGGPAETDGRSAILALLDGLSDGAEPPSAIVAFNDACAVGAMDALVSRGLRVPDDIAVTGYDDTPLARLGLIDLTTLRQDAPRLGAAAVAAVVSRLDDGRSDPTTTVFPPELIVRGSSGARGRS